MDIEFASKRLIEASVSIAEASRLFGVPIGRKYFQRLAVLRSAERFTELYGLQSLRLHPLKGSRTGLFSITLTSNYRLILAKVQDDKVKIIDVEDYHGN